MIICRWCFLQYFHSEHCQRLADECVAACHRAVEVARDSRPSPASKTVEAAPVSALYPEVYGLGVDRASTTLCSSVAECIQLAVAVVLSDYFRWASELPVQQNSRDKVCR
jgi:hypothetical protein